MAWLFCQEMQPDEAAWAESQGKDALTCTVPKTSASTFLFMNGSSFSPVSSSPENYIKINGLFKNKIFHRNVPLWSIFFLTTFFFFKVIKLPAKLFFKIFFISGSQNGLFVFALKIWGTSLKTLGKLAKTMSALSAFRKKKSNSVYFYTSKISLYNLTSLSLWLPHASSLSQCPKGSGQQQPQESIAHVAR